jgi:protein-disulfide isomerase
LFRIRLMASLLAVFMAAGCKAQTVPPQPTPAESLLDRHIEVMVRTQFNVPQDYSVILGARKPSQIPGYDTLPVSLVRGEKATNVEFLLSTDGKTLARLETFDLAKDPVFNIDVAGRPIRGNPQAKVTVVNFDDLECPYCSRMHETLFPSTINRYKDKVRFIYKDNPLTEMHPWATHAAVDANCLADQNGNVYWTYVDYLHGHGQEITGPDRDLPKSFAALDRIAKQEGTVAKLDEPKLAACIAKQDDSAVKTSLKEAETMRIESAPAVFVDGERIDGWVPQEVLWSVIDRALRAAGVDPPPPAPPAPAQAAGTGR